MENYGPWPVGNDRRGHCSCLWGESNAQESQKLETSFQGEQREYRWVFIQTYSWAKLTPTKTWWDFPVQKHAAGPFEPADGIPVPGYPPGQGQDSTEAQGLLAQLGWEPHPHRSAHGASWPHYHQERHCWDLPSNCQKLKSGPVHLPFAVMWHSPLSCLVLVPHQ